MRIFYVALISAFLFTLPSASSASDVKDNRSTSNDNMCVANVKDGTAAFYFPIVDNANWVWFQNNTKDNALEYSWEIVIDSSKSSYKFGYYLFKYPGRKQREGSLTKLLLDAQISVFEFVSRPSGGTSGSLRDDLIVRAGVIDQWLIITFKDSKTFNTILKDKPKSAQFVVRDPTEAKSFICNATIKYY